MHVDWPTKPPWWRTQQITWCWAPPPTRSMRSPVPEAKDSPCRLPQCQNYLHGRGCPGGSRECRPTEKSEIREYPHREHESPNPARPLGYGDVRAPVGYDNIDWRFRGGRAYPLTYYPLDPHITCDACGGFLPGGYPGNGPEDYGDMFHRWESHYGDLRGPASGQVGDAGDVANAAVGLLVWATIVGGAFGLGYYVGRR